MTTTPGIYRVSHRDRGLIADVDSVEAVEGVMRAGGPGRYHVDQISADPLPGGHTSRRSGVGIKRNDETVTIKPDRWPES